MKWNKIMGFSFSAVGMLALILDGRTALQGAAEGLALCLRAVIPSLFPFLFLSSILTAALWGSSLGFARPITRALGIPAGAEPVLIAGFLGGYPAGAQTIAQAYHQGCLDRKTACHLLAFCSNAGPAFLFGITASQFQDTKTVWILWAIHILSSLMVGALGNSGMTGQTQLPQKEQSTAQALNGAVKTMGIICGWVVLFRILMAFLDRWILWAVPSHFRPLIWGLLELSNGCCALNTVASEDLRFVFCSVMLSFGGLCVAMQTASVMDGLPVGTYLRGKLMQTLFALGLSVCWVLDYGMAVVILPPVLLLPRILKKRGSISSLSRV